MLKGLKELDKSIIRDPLTLTLTRYRPVSHPVTIISNIVSLAVCSIKVFLSVLQGYMRHIMDAWLMSVKGMAHLFL